MFHLYHVQSESQNRILIMVASQACPGLQIYMGLELLDDTEHQPHH